MCSFSRCEKNRCLCSGCYCLVSARSGKLKLDPRDPKRDGVRTGTDNAPLRRESQRKAAQPLEDEDSDGDDKDVMDVDGFKVLDDDDDKKSAAQDASEHMVPIPQAESIAVLKEICTHARHRSVVLVRRTTNQGIEMRCSRNVGNSVQHCERSTERKSRSEKRLKPRQKG